MKQKYSLKNKIEFNKIFKQGKKVKSPELLISIIKSDDFKIGISVPKKIGNAVIRNKTKRQIKNIIADSNVYDINKHVIIIVRAPWMKLNYADRKVIFEKQINKIR